MTTAKQSSLKYFASCCVPYPSIEGTYWLMLGDNVDKRIGGDFSDLKATVLVKNKNYW